MPVDDIRGVNVLFFGDWYQKSDPDILCFNFESMDEILDILIIGGGPIGLACGLEAKKAGLRYLILEKGVLVNSLYHYPSNMTFFSTSERIEIGDIPFVSNNVKPPVPKHWNITGGSLFHRTEYSFAGTSAGSECSQANIMK